MLVRRLPQAMLMVVLIALLSAFLLYPIWLTIQGGFRSTSPGGGFTLHHILSVFTDPALRQGLINSFAIALCTTLLCTIIALPLAVLGARYEFPGKSILSALILVPMILPPFVGAIGISHLLGRAGAVNSLLMNLGLIDVGIDFLG